MIHKQQQLQQTDTQIAEAAVGNEKNVRYYTSIACVV